MKLVNNETQIQSCDLSPGCCVAATPRHVWRLQSWHTLFPEAQLWASRPTLLTLKRGEPATRRHPGGFASSSLGGRSRPTCLQSNSLAEEVFFFHRKSRTVILDDFIQNVPLQKGTPLRNAFLKVAGVAYPHGGVGSTSGCRSRIESWPGDRSKSCFRGILTS